MVGTDSHTTMVNGAAVLGWGVGGIEAEAAMLGQPISMLIPEVIGFELTGAMMEGTTGTDLVLKVVEMLREKGVVGKFVEFYGSGLDSLPLADRATIANMAPEYGATCGFFPIDNETIRYLHTTGREEDRIALVEAYAKENGFDSENLSISYKSRKFFDSLEKIQYEDYPGTREQKQKEIDGLEGREEAIKDITLKEKVLDAFLATMGHMAKNKKGAELKKFAISVGTMLLNNDGTGIRRYSSENYVELGINPDKTITTIDKKTGEEIVSEPGTKNEHLNSRVQFGADIVEALLQGKLTPDNIKMLTSQYLSVIGSKNGQIFTDKTLGATIENSGQLKMLVSRMFDMDLSAIDIKTLKDFYNWRTGETAYTEMIRDFTEKTIKSRLFADKGAEAAYADMAKEIDADNFVYFKDAVSTKVLSNKVIALDKAFEEGANPNKKPKGISVFDFDDTLARTKSNVLYTLPDGTKGKLNATEFAKKSEALEAKGAEFDFSEFSKVVKGELGPLFSEAQKKEGKYTNKDIFVLTARPSNSAMAIYKFLKSEGLEIPIDNIVGLGDGAAKAKAAWMVDKVSEGYNDFYFADDAIKMLKLCVTL